MSHGKSALGNAMLNILFIHQNFPGQFEHLAAHLAKRPNLRVVGLGEARNVARGRKVAGVTILAYRHEARQTSGHPYLHGLENQLCQGQAVLRALLQIKKQGFMPQLICVHPSWGEAMFLREAFPQSKIIDYCEFFYRADGSDVGFDPEFPQQTLDSRCRLRLRNTAHLLALDDCDRGWSPTRWQAQQLPVAYRDKVSVIHEGIDTRKLVPRSTACFTYGSLALTSADSVLTYVARNLEPYRGFHIFMRALPRILAANPKTRVVIVGGDKVSYGQAPVGAAHWRAKLQAELGEQLDAERVHFVGKLPYDRYLALLQVSSAHVYLTYPFVLSWSLLEAMASACAVIASRTAPVEEVIVHRQNGVLVDFFDVAALAEAVSDVLGNPMAYAAMRRQARETIQAGYELNDLCLPRQVEMLEEALG